MYIGHFYSVKMSYGNEYYLVIPLCQRTVCGCICCSILLSNNIYHNNSKEYVFYYLPNYYSILYKEVNDEGKDITIVWSQFCGFSSKHNYISIYYEKLASDKLSLDNI